MIKAIIFDWGGVLIYNPSIKLMKYFAKRFKLELEEFIDVFCKYEKVFQKGKITEKKLWKKVCKNLNIKQIPKQTLWYEAVRKIFKDRIKIYSLIKKLRSLGYKTAIISNTEIPAVKYFFNNGYDKYFDVVTFSCLEHTVKPEKKIFEITLKKLNLKPEECIFIDDKIEYVKSAQKIGIKGIVFVAYKILLKQLKNILNF